MPEGDATLRTPSLVNTVKPYRRHLLACTGHRAWPARIEDAGDVLGSMAAEARARAAAGGPPVMVTAIDAPSRGAGVDVIGFPEARRYVGVDSSSWRAVLDGDSAPTSERVPGRIVLVCRHGARDARCGACGPKIAAALSEASRDAGLDVRVWGSSHVGGHKFAGNVLIYPDGVWYGYVRVEDVPRIVEEHLVAGRVLEDLLRGRMQTA